MVATSGFVRLACGLVSATAHVVAFVAFGHPAPPSIGPQTDRSEFATIDVAPAPTSELTESSETPAQARDITFVPPLNHTHPYPIPPDHDAHPHDPRLIHLPIPPSTASREEASIADPPAPPRFVMAVTNWPAETSTSQNPPASRDARPGADAEPVSETRVSVPARLVAPVVPKYPPEARSQEIEADVVLGIVVGTSGQVADARVLQPAGYGFDREALTAVRNARFSPAELDGQPVAVRMRWSVSFRLH